MSTGRRVDVPNAVMLQIHLREERDPEIRLRLIVELPPQITLETILRCLQVPMSTAALFIIPATALRPRPASDRVTWADVAVGVAVAAARARAGGAVRTARGVSARRNARRQSCRRGGGAADVEIVHGRECGELAVAQAMTPVMIQRRPSRPSTQELLRWNRWAGAWVN